MPTDPLPYAIRENAFQEGLEQCSRLQEFVSENICGKIRLVAVTCITLVVRAFLSEFAEPLMEGNDLFLSLGGTGIARETPC
jgi:hypothetical protein